MPSLEGMASLKPTYFPIFERTMNTKIFSRLLLLLCLSLLCAAGLHAEPPRELTHRDSVFLSHLRRRMDVSAEYMAPYDASRMIRTVDLNIYPSIQMFNKVHLSIGVGVTATYAWGNIVQYGTNFQDVTMQTAAFGIGPGFLIRFEPLIVGRFSLSLDVNEALIIYTRHFPAGGDIYNFMSKLGGALCYRISKHDKIGVGGRWMHVSNGQGLTQHNPSYPAAGVNISVIHFF